MEHLIGPLFEGVFAALSMSWGTARRAGKSFRHPSTWEEGDGSFWTWAAAFGLLLPVIPMTVFTLRFGAFALKLADDDMLFMLGILFFLPIAAFAVAAAAMAAAWSLWIAAALLTGRPGAAWYAALFVALMAGLSVPGFTSGLTSYAWWMLGTSFASAVLLAARAAANSARPARQSYFG